MSIIPKFLAAIILLAIVAVIVSKSSSSVSLINSITATFTKLTGVVVSPVGNIGASQ